MASLVSKVIWASKETEVTMDLWVPEVRMDLRDKRGNQDSLEKQEHWVLLGKRVTSVYQDCPDPLEDKDKRVHLAFLE